MAVTTKFSYPVNPPTGAAASLSFAYPVGLEVIWEGSDWSPRIHDLKQQRADVITLLLSIAGPHGFVRARLRQNIHITTTSNRVRYNIGPHITVNFQTQADIVAGTYVAAHIFTNPDYTLTLPPPPAVPPASNGTNPEIFAPLAVVGGPAPDKYLANPPKIPPAMGAWTL